MVAAYYRPLLACAASLLLALAGCGSGGGDEPATTQTASSSEPGEIDTEATLWTALGIVDRPNAEPGPKTGFTVSPVLWQATHETLDFVPIATEDANSGLITTDWYSPQGKPGERYRANIYILARALRSDSLKVSLFRQVRRGADWVDSTIDRQIEVDLENAILDRARQIRRARSTSM